MSHDMLWPIRSEAWWWRPAIQYNTHSLLLQCQCISENANFFSEPTWCPVGIVRHFGSTLLQRPSRQLAQHWEKLHFNTLAAISYVPEYFVVGQNSIIYWIINDHYYFLPPGSTLWCSKCTYYVCSRRSDPDPDVEHSITGGVIINTAQQANTFTIA